MKLLSHLFELARKEWGFEATQNPVRFIRKPKVPRGRTRRPSPQELEALRETCHPRLWALISFAIETGMRRGEIARLACGHVGLERCVVQLHETKNGDPRTVPLSSRTLSILRNLLQQSSDSKSVVFGFESADSITKAFSRACRAASIRGLHFHDLRHEAVSRLFERGLSLPEVATLSGHKTWAMLRRYTHLSAESLVSKLG